MARRDGEHIWVDPTTLTALILRASRVFIDVDYNGVSWAARMSKPEALGLAKTIGEAQAHAASIGHEGETEHEFEATVWTRTDPAHPDRAGAPFFLYINAMLI